MYEVFPDNKAVPPVAAAYQSIVSPEPGVAVKVSVPFPHLLTPEPVGTEGKLFTVNVSVIVFTALHPVPAFTTALNKVV